MYLTVEQKIGLFFVLISVFVGTILLNREDTKNIEYQKEVLMEYVPEFPVNVNSADSTQLVSIPGIGPKIASEILKLRRKKGKFNKIEDLLEAKGVGISRLEKIKPYIVIR